MADEEWEPLVLMQVQAVIDENTTVVCLHAHGMIEEAGPALTAGEPPWDMDLGALSEAERKALYRQMTAERNRLWDQMDAAMRAGHSEASVQWLQDLADQYGDYATEITAFSKNLRRAGAVRVTYPDFDLPKPGEHSWEEIKAQALRNRAVYAARGTGEKEVADLVASWTGAGNSIADVRQQIAAGEIDAVIQAVRQGPAAPVSLWRGMAPETMEDYQFMRTVVPGEMIDLRGLASFSEKKDHASRFLGYGGDEGLLIEVVDGNGLPTMSISNTPSEAEWLLTDRLRVVEVVERRVLEDPDEFEDESEYPVMTWVRAVLVHEEA